MSIKLLKCPFCGELPALKIGTSSSQGGGKTARIECACGICTKEVEDWTEKCEDVVIRIWNTRQENS
jgi:hypothetical protein